jgi:uroporphyrinogen-III synthase
MGGLLVRGEEFYDNTSRMRSQRKDRRPLRNLRILVTRPEGQEEEIRTLLRGLGAAVTHIPTIRIVPPPSWKLLDAAIRGLDSCDWLLFTSANGSRHFFQRLRRLGRSSDSISAKIGAIGPKTAEAVRKEGARVARTPTEFRGEGLARALGRVRGKKILLVRSEKARDALPKELRRHGAAVDVVAAYRTVPAELSRRRLRRLAARRGADLVVFTSSSTVENMRALLGAGGFRRFFRGALAASIGPITTGTLRRFGVEPAVEGGTFTAKGLVEAIRKAASRLSSVE